MDRPSTDKPGPEHFPLGSAQSRAAARAELDRRQCTTQETTVLFWVNFPKTDAVTPRAEQTIDPNTVECYRTPDGSIIRVVSIDWDGNGKRVSVFLNQQWPDGRDYDGTLRVHSIEEARRLPCASEHEVTGVWLARRVPVPASWRVSANVSVFARYVRLGADGNFHDAPEGCIQIPRTNDAQVDRVVPPTSVPVHKDAKEPQPVIVSPGELTYADQSGETLQVPHAAREQAPSAVSLR